MISAERLSRSGSDRMLSGVSGGLGGYFDVDPVFVRLGWVVLCFITFGLAVVLYIALVLIMPKDSSAVFNETDTGRLGSGPGHGGVFGDRTPPKPSPWLVRAGADRDRRARSAGQSGHLLLGGDLALVLIGLGAAALASRKSFSR